MKVLTLWQPWASFLVHGIKKIETRPSPTNWTAEKGIYLIHAAQKWDKQLAEICIQELFKSELEKLGFIHKYEDDEIGYKGYSFSFPMGAIIGAVEVLECVRIINYPSQDIFSPIKIKGKKLEYPECEFGDYRDGRFAWLCQNPRVLKTPIPYKGGQGYYQNFKGDKSLIEYL